jgi:pimeloyl-ACP methyl ester carboxylesterase
VPPRTNRLRSFVALGALILFVGACSSDARSVATSASVAPASSPPTDSKDGNLFSGTAAEFYVVPTPLPPGSPGDLIRIQQVPEPGLTAGTLYRVMYHSQSVQGADIAVTGLITVPNSAPPPDGRNVLSWAHGTVGLGDDCAPSKQPDPFSIGAFATPFVDEGIIVAATDYEGLGTPGVHPYIVGESEGRGVVDIVRAARHLSFAHASNRFVVWGHSQGGHAALFANQIAPTWAPELHLLGTAAAAPATELPLLGVLFQGQADQTLLMMAIDGFHAAYPDADLRAILTDEAISLMPKVTNSCSDFDVFKGKSYTDLIKSDPAKTPPWSDLALQNDPGHTRMDSPLLIIHGSSDTTIPAAASQLLFTRLCKLGQVVTRKVYDGQTHTTVVPTAFPDVKHWIDDRFAGKPAPSSCPSP